MAGDGPISAAPEFPSLDYLFSEFLTITRAEDISLHNDLRKLCKRIENLSTRRFRLHPSKCRCLRRSYGLLLHRPFFVDRISRIPVPDGFGTFVRNLLHTLQEGEEFLQNCTFRTGRMDSIILCYSASGRQWLINKAIPIALSTEILDVHLQNFVGCIFALVRRMVRMVCAGSSAQSLLLQKLKDGLEEIWASADDEGDSERMQELFNNIKSNPLREICKCIATRLYEATREAQLAGASDLPPYLWMDSLEMEKIPVVLSNHQPHVVPIKLMGKQFACKHFQGPGSSKQFTNEAVLQASLRHANVMHLLWCTRRSAGSHYLVMELMDEDLGQVIEKRRKALNDPPFSLLAGIDIILQIAQGMQYLHDLGIMHRDLKSFNILVRHSQHADGTNRLSVKVSDFGLSKVKNNISLFSTKLIGTDIWIAPEVLNSEDETKYTNKADVYSFAIVCSEILTGLGADELLPCKRGRELHKVVKEGRRPQLPSSCPRAIADYIKKCWDGDASRRPTFKQICTVFQGFKACLLSGETELLASSLPCNLYKWPDFQAVEVEGGFLGMLRQMDHTIEMAGYLSTVHQVWPLRHLRRLRVCVERLLLRVWSWCLCWREKLVNDVYAT